MMLFQRLKYGIRGIRFRLRVWLRKDAVEAELDEEVRFHILENMAEKMRAGVPASEARRQALLAFGGMDRFKEQVRESRGGRPLEDLVQDLRYAFRTLRRRPGFTAAAVGALALGIGASTTLFSAVNGVLLKPLDYADSDRLVQMGLTRGESPSLRGLNMPQLLDLMERATSLESVVAARGSAFDLLGQGEPERVTASRVTPEFFQTLGAHPVLGRSFTTDEHRTADAHVAIISHGLWQRKWGGRADIVGQSFRASEEFVEGVTSYTIVGVAPPGFRNPAPLESRISRSPRTQFWMPLSLDPTVYAADRWYWRFFALGKLKNGVSFSTANQEVAQVGESLARVHPDRYRLGGQPLSLSASPLLEVTVGNRSRDLLILMGATGLLLLVACGNVAGLLLARAADRGREMGIRAAMGAGRRRLFRQLLTESLVLGGMGGVVGMGFAFLGVGSFRALGPVDFPRLAEVSVDTRVLLFGFLTAMAAGILFGLAPAFISSGPAARASVREGHRGSTGSRRIGRVRAGLVAGELAMALVLLTGSGLLFRSFLSLQGVDPGMDPHGLAMLQVNLPASYAEPDQRLSFFRQLSGSLAELPGVRLVSHTEDPPMGSNVWYPWLWREGEEERLPRQAAGHTVGTDYFATLGIPILAGRAFGPQDDENGAPAVIINETLAREVWPGMDPIGRRLDFGPRSEAPAMTVVGVARAIRQTSLADGEGWEMYVPYAQRAESPRAYFLVRATSHPSSLSGALREAVRNLDPNLPVPEITTMEARLASTLHLPRFRTLLLGAFALLALVLATTGVYGTMLYVVSRRTREVGIRRALGAQAKDVVGMILRQGSLPVAVGLGVGLAGSVAATRLLKSFLFGVTPWDPGTFVLVTAALGGVALLATFIPARKAASIEPMRVLGEE